MLYVTPEARSHLLHVRQDRGLDDTVGARFAASAGRVGLTFAPAPEPGDQVVEGDDIAVFLAPEIATLADSVIDARTEEGKTVLILRPEPPPS
jgi:Fe-S cluster assembly iron-binding protein IscA